MIKNRVVISAKDDAIVPTRAFIFATDCATIHKIFANGGRWMQQTIVPDKQSVENCLKQKTYHIDFYQREYVWSEETALTLLKDIVYNFELGYEQNKNSEITETLMERFNWYYLNVYITNNINGKNYIVDGQQRLTTLTLIATKLYHLLDKSDKLRELLGQCVFSNNGFKDIFNLDNDKRYSVMDCIFNEKTYSETYKNKTEENLLARYKDISSYLDERFKDSTDHKRKVFVLYFLKRLVLVELAITQDDTPMVFEVINDRGEALKPFEILKGKLIGALPKSDTESFCEKWDQSFLQLMGIEDDFFSDLIKSKFVFKRNSNIAKNINNQYHRYIFENNDIANTLQFRKQDDKHIGNIKKFITQDIVYYSKLYKKIIYSEDISLRYCKEINGLSGQYQNILSACEINDKDEDEKIKRIAREYDRFWVLLNLNGIYDSNEFQDLSYQLNESLKNANINEYINIFDDLLAKTIKEKRNLATLHSLLDFQNFMTRNYTNTNTKFLRYLFARVEQFICEHINEKPKNDVFYIASKTGEKTAYHIEHILSRNETNLSYFDNEEEFEKQRNLLGGLLLLKDKVNISSNNEEYEDKLKTYNASLVWGRSLCSDFYHHTNKDFLNFNKSLKDGVQFESYDKFDKVALEKRSKLLYEIIKIIWEVDRYNPK